MLNLNSKPDLKSMLLYKFQTCLILHVLEAQPNSQCQFITFARARMQLVSPLTLRHALIFLIVHQLIVYSHVVHEYLSSTGRFQSTTVWLSMLILNAGFARWGHCEISPR